MLASQRHFYSFWAPALMGLASLSLLAWPAWRVWRRGTSVAGANCLAGAAGFLSGTPFGSIILMVAAVVTVIWLISFGQQIWANQKLFRKILFLDADVYPVLKIVSEKLNLDRSKIHLINSSAPLCFCAGFWRPQIYVSPSAVLNLTEDELTAVLAHEQYHLVHYDPLRQAVLAAFRRALFFVPLFHWSEKRHNLAKEVAADAAAAAQIGRGALARALYKMSPAGRQSQESFSFFANQSILEIRVEVIAGENFKYNIPLSLKQLLISAISLTILLLVFVRPLRVASAPGCPPTVNDQPVNEYFLHNLPEDKIFNSYELSIKL